MKSSRGKEKDLFNLRKHDLDAGNTSMELPMSSLNVYILSGDEGNLRRCSVDWDHLEVSQPHGVRW